MKEENPFTDEDIDDEENEGQEDYFDEHSED